MWAPHSPFLASSLQLSPCFPGLSSPTHLHPSFLLFWDNQVRGAKETPYSHPFLHPTRPQEKGALLLKVIPSQNLLIISVSPAFFPLSSPL